MSEENVVVISTTLGEIVIETDPKSAPLTSANFMKLAAEGYYNKTTFHRVIPDFMIQGGDPNSRDEDRSSHGTGGPDYTIPAEIKLPNVRGSVATARLGDAVNPEKESSGSQFFINVKNNTFLDGNYTVFGTVIKGMEIADKIVKVSRDRNDNPLQKIEMEMRLASKSEVV